MTHATDPTLIERAAEAMEHAEFGYTLNLTRLVDGESTYTLTFDDGTLPQEFESTDEAYVIIAKKRRESQARAALSVIPEAGEEAVRAEREAIADMADEYAMNIRSQICKVSESDTVNSIDASAKWNRATALEDFAFCVRARTKDEAND